MSERSWLLLIHNLPPKPAYFRVKIWRRLQAIGAVAVKSSVYALPDTDPSHESFAWIHREINQGGGDAVICSARLVGGLNDAQIEGMFMDARNSDYEALSADARKLLKSFLGKKGTERKQGALPELQRLKRRFSEIASIDFFGAPGKEGAETALQAIERALSPEGPHVRRGAGPKLDALKNRVWVTREGVRTDRMASAWLIRRFIDPKARFKFVPAKGYVPARNEIRFDMYEAEFTHEEDHCTFEVLVNRLPAPDRALRALAEIIHDIDLQDGKHGRPEAAGVEASVQGIHLSHSSDAERIDRGIALFDNLHRYLLGKTR